MRNWLRFTLGIAITPCLALALLMLTRELKLAPGLAAIAATICVSLFLAWGWHARLTQIAEAVQEALGQAAPEPQDHSPAPASLEAEALAFGIRRVTRSMAEQRLMLDSLRRADAAILENLPAPVLLLSSDRTVLRANSAARDMLGPDSGGQGPDVAALLRHP